jgi:hypothetical protein
MTRFRIREPGPREPEPVVKLQDSGPGDIVVQIDPDGQGPLNVARFRALDGALHLLPLGEGARSVLRKGGVRIRNQWLAIEFEGEALETGEEE